MCDNIVIKVPPFFKIVSMVIFCFTVLICYRYFGIILLFGVLLFILTRSNINYDIFIINPFILILMFIICFSLHLQYIYIFKFLLIYYYFKYLIRSNNYMELDNSFISKYHLFNKINKYKIFKDKYKLLTSTNKAIYGRRKYINSIYLAYRTCSSNNDKKYVLINYKKNLYSYLFVFLHSLIFIYVLLLEVYK